MWKSFTPFAPPRHQGRKVFDGSSEWRSPGSYPTGTLPAPIGVDVLKEGSWLSFWRHRPGGWESRSEERSAYRPKIDFEEPVFEPIVIGALSHLGLGLFLPAR